MEHWKYLICNFLTFQFNKLFQWLMYKFKCTFVVILIFQVHSLLILVNKFLTFTRKLSAVAYIHQLLQCMLHFQNFISAWSFMIIHWFVVNYYYFRKKWIVLLLVGGKGFFSSGAFKMFKISLINDYLLLLLLFYYIYVYNFEICLYLITVLIMLFLFNILECLLEIQNKY